MEFLALPNLHPAVVHFPIALATVALLFDVVGPFLKKHDWLDRTGATLWILAGIGAFFAMESGENAADSLAKVPPQADPVIARHSDFAHWAAYLLLAFALLRLGATIWDPQRERRGARFLLLLPELALVGLVFYTADLGGTLVYQHGVAVQMDQEATEDDGAPPDEMGGATDEATDDAATGNGAADPLVTEDDGTARWTPEDAAALDAVEPLPGTDLSAVLAASGEDGERGSEGDGLLLDVDGTAWIALPGDHGDVRVEAKIGVAGFEGTVGLFHHGQGPDQASLVEHATDGTTRLVEIRSRRDVLHEATKDLPEGPFTLGISAAGSHFKGLLDGETVTHGHVEPGPAGRCGLYLDGQGEVRILSVVVIPTG